MTIKSHIVIVLVGQRNSNIKTVVTNTSTDASEERRSLPLPSFPPMRSGAAFSSRSFSVSPTAVEMLL